MKHSSNCNTKRHNHYADRFFEEFIGGLEGAFGRDMNPINNFIPKTNIIENEENFQLEISAVGRSKSDFKILMDKNILTVETREDAKVPEDLEGKYRKREFKHGALKRSFTLAENMDKDNISATYLNGILRLNIPKIAKEEMAKEVEIS